MWGSARGRYHVDPPPQPLKSRDAGPSAQCTLYQTPLPPGTVPGGPIFCQSRVPSSGTARTNWVSHSQHRPAVLLRQRQRPGATFPGSNHGARPTDFSVQARTHLSLLLRDEPPLLRVLEAALAVLALAALAPAHPFEAVSALLPLVAQLVALPAAPSAPRVGAVGSRLFRCPGFALGLVLPLALALLGLGPARRTRRVRGRPRAAL